MAFAIHTTDDGRVPGLEYLPCGAVTPKAGMAMVLAGGVLKAASGMALPAYLCMTQRDSACAAGDLIPVIRVSGDIIFEAETPADFSPVPGERAQLAADGLGLSADAGGAAEVVYTDTDVTRVRFVRPGSAA